MKVFAFAVVVCLALAAGTSAETDPCVDEMKLCRDVMCHGREVIQNKCEHTQGGFMKSCGCGGDLIEDEAAQLGQAEEEQPMEDCDDMEEGGDMAELGQPMQVPRGFAFSFNLGGDRPQQQQQQAPRVYSYSTPMQSLFGDSGDDEFTFPSVGMLFNIMRARQQAQVRQQFLQNSPSYMTRRVYFPESGQTFRLVTRDELEDQQQEEEEEQRQVAVKAAVIGRLQEAMRPRAQAEESPAERMAHQLAQRVRARQERDVTGAPKPAVRLNKAPSSMPEAVMPEPLNMNDPAAQREINGKRMLYCVASIALIMSVMALNASLLMCCARSREDSDVDVEVVAATTPLLVEYEVEKVASCKGYEMSSPAEFKPLQREGTKA